MELIRSFLFAPGSNVKVMNKALNAGADAVIFDLEDAVAVNSKGEARQNVREIMQQSAGKPCKIFVRINSWNSDFGYADLAELKDYPFDGFMLPKAEYAKQVEEVSLQLPEQAELIPLIETALGVINAYSIARCPKVSRLAFGAIDYTLDINTSLSKEGTEILYARSYLVVASKAAGIAPPVDTVFPDLEDAAGLEKDLLLGKQLGMFGKLLIHPKQLPVTNAVFTPTFQEVEYAEKVLEAFKAAEQQGVASIKVDGRFVDYPVVERCKKIIKLAGIQISNKEKSGELR